MTLPLYNKPGHPWHTQLSSPSSCLHQIMFGILFVLVFGVLCTMSLIVESTGTNLVQRLGRREVPAGDSFIPDAEVRK